MAGWIKLHRDIMESATFETLMVKQQMIAIKLLLKANYEDGVWTDKKNGNQVPYKRGQLIISTQKIADEWFKNDKDVTRQIVRTTLDRLEKLDFLTKHTTNHYTLVTITNYSVYQEKDGGDNQRSNQDLTKTQPRLNQDLTTVKELKELKELSSKELRPKSAPSDDDFKNANLLYELAMQNNSRRFPKKPNLEKWANDFRLLRERDNAKEEEVEHLIRWSQNDDFWQMNAWSSQSFRKQYARLYHQEQQDKKKKRNHLQLVVNAGNRQQELDEIINNLEKEQGAIE